MSLPGFIATASLNGVNQRYSMAGSNFTSEGAEGVIPQLGTTMEDWWNQWMMGEGGGGGGVVLPLHVNKPPLIDISNVYVLARPICASRCVGTNT